MTYLFCFKSAISQVVLHLFTIVWQLLVEPTAFSSSVWFFQWLKYVIESKIVLIASEFPTSAKFRGNIKIPRQRKNSMVRVEKYHWLCTTLQLNGGWCSMCSVFLHTHWINGPWFKSHDILPPNNQIFDMIKHSS